MIQRLGDFKAQDAAGLGHVILIYHDEKFGHFGLGDAPLILTTDQGESVHRIARGIYAIEREPWVLLTSHDPQAP